MKKTILTIATCLVFAANSEARVILGKRTSTVLEGSTLYITCAWAPPYMCIDTEKPSTYFPTYRIRLYDEATGTNVVEILDVLNETVTNIDDVTTLHTFQLP